MRSERCSLLIAVMVFLLACVCGCTMTPNTAPVPVSTSAAPGVPPVPSYTQVTSAYQAAKSSGLDTTIDIHFNDFYCLDLQKTLGVDYLYPDQSVYNMGNIPGGGDDKCESPSS